MSPEEWLASKVEASSLQTSTSHLGEVTSHIDVYSMIYPASFVGSHLLGVSMGKRGHPPTDMSYGGVACAVQEQVRLNMLFCKAALLACANVVKTASLAVLLFWNYDMLLIARECLPG